MRCKSILYCIVLVSLLAASGSVSSQDYRYVMRKARESTLYPTGVIVLPGALEPTLRKWYVPQEFISQYRWGGWEYTNYAKNFYQRYRSAPLYGDYFYDIFGQPITLGWQIYDWSQTQPKQFGSSLWIGGGPLGALMVATDSKGEYHYAITFGRSRTTLTPMTFHKPTFSGIQWDFQAERYTGTLLLSRISSPVGGFMGTPNESTNNTHLIGGRITSQLGDFVTLGATFVNSHQSNTILGFGRSNPFEGSLTTGQNEHNISLIKIRLSDDSPEDGEAGAAFFSENIIITDTDGNRREGKDIGFHPTVEGGLQRIGHLAADGNEAIVLTYDFTHPLYKGPEPSRIKRISFQLALANDYKVEVTSDRQTNIENELVFLTITRAEQNIKDKSNLRLVSFDYGLPTANQILGFTVEVVDVGGFHLQAEFDFNKKYRQYPNVDLIDHHTSALKSNAWYINTAYRKYPWLLFGEIFHMDHDYTTSGFLTAKGGGIDYEDELHYLYEFVDDNDDQDGLPDWERLVQGRGDPSVFPGWDENGDFISDFNQNNNFFPDYEEPFLRYSVDRPEYLFGIDSNNNGWIDRFENDRLPDYPYKKDHQGYNFYLTGHITPNTKLSVGRLRQGLASGDRRNLTDYLLFAMDESYPSLGRLRVFESLKRTRDNIPDDLFQWVQPINAGATLREFPDPLAFRNTWVNTTFLGFDYTQIRDLNFINKLKYEILHQRDSDDILEERRANRNSTFLGVINKVDYTHRIGNLLIQPKWKSEYLIESPYLKTDPKRNELRETFSFILETGFAKRHKGRVFKSTSLGSGIEITFFNQFQDPAPSEFEDDFFGVVWVTQFRNSTAFLGYRLITQSGFRLNRQEFEGRDARTTGTLFFTVFAGIQE